MRRASCRSVPRTKRPPSAFTASYSSFVAGFPPRLLFTPPPPPPLAAPPPHPPPPPQVFSPFLPPFPRGLPRGFCSPPPPPLCGPHPPRPFPPQQGGARCGHQ